jgi:hypothetical protein
MPTAVFPAILSLAVVAQARRSSDQQAMRSVVDRFVDAWNRHDAAAIAEDADFTNWRGVGDSGISHANVCNTLKNSHLG